MKLDVVLGLQWGDEGKGKIVDVLAERYPIVARFQGGPNAGHSLHFDGKSFVLRSVPSGIFRDEAKNIVGNGVVLDPITFMGECTNIESKTGIPVHLNHIFTSQFVGTRTEFSICFFVKHQLSDTIAVAKVNEGHTAHLTKALHPTRKCNHLSCILNAEFTAIMRSIHQIIMI